jgi:hypothetical protein
MPSMSAYMRGAKAHSATASEYLESSDRWAMEIVDTAIDDLATRPDGVVMRTALRNRLLNETVGARVFRYIRLAEMSTEAIDALADRAEREMVLICKRKGLPL